MPNSRQAWATEKCRASTSLTKATRSSDTGTSFQGMANLLSEVHYARKCYLCLLARCNPCVLTRQEYLRACHPPPTRNRGVQSPPVATGGLELTFAMGSLHHEEAL